MAARMLSSSLPGVALALLLATPAAASDPPKLTKAQRDTLQAVVAGVDAAAAQPPTPGLDWQIHVLRASDGSHYVAFSIDTPPGWPARGAVPLYVRLATRLPVPPIAAERSAVMEWLKGLRGDPMPQRPTQIITIPNGELPVGGPSSMSTRDSGAGQALAALRLADHQQERARQAQEERDRKRKAELEGSGDAARRALLPFEDFDMAATATEVDSTLVLRRSLTAAPGDYDLYVAWTVPAAKGPPAVRVLKREVTLPPMPPAELALSTIILADDVQVRETVYPADQQTAHPYSIGATEITPARDDRYTNDERLAVFFQVVNPTATPAGKPDVAIGFRLFQTTADGEKSLGALDSQYYNETTLPADFDVNLGHPVFAAMAARLATLPRGTFRLNVVATDRLSRRTASGDATFRIIATPANLLKTAPSAAPPFRRDRMLQPAMVQAVVARLTPPAPSPALARALAAAAEGRFVEVLREQPAGPGEDGIWAVLRGMALYALGDSARAVTVPLRRALEAGAPAGSAQVFLAACQAIDGYDRSAVADWDAAIEGGVDRTVLTPLLIDAHLRLGDAEAASTLANRLLSERPGDPAAVRGLAAAHVAAGRSADAITVLDANRIDASADPDTHYLMLKALFTSAMSKSGPGAEPSGIERFTRLAQAYIAGKGAHADVVAEWMGVVK